MRAACTATCTQFPYPFRITIADNASTDRTPEIARHWRRSCRGYGCGVWTRRAGVGPADGVVGVGRAGAGLHGRRPVHRPGRPAALVAPLISGRPDVAIGSRLARGSRVVRGLKREALSRGYNLLLRGTLAARFTDAQCGFKAIRKDVADSLLPLARDRAGSSTPSCWCWPNGPACRTIHEVPVDWVDDPDNQADIMPTVVADRGIRDWDARWSAARSR